MIKILLTIIVCAYLGAAFLLFFKQRDYIYLPTDPEEHDYAVEEVSVEGATLQLIVINSGQDRAVLYFGGNAESVALSAESLAGAFPNYTMYLVDYRGYGGSSGAPTEQALLADAVEVFDKIAGRHNDVAIIGRSLGSGVASYLASVRPATQLVLVTPFDSIQHIAQNQYPIFPVSLMLRDKYRSIDYVADLSAETLVLIAENDVVIPAKYSDNLIAAFPAPPYVVMIKDAGHENITTYPQYYTLIEGFLARRDKTPDADER